MKKVKYSPERFRNPYLTPGKVYDVLVIDQDVIYVANDVDIIDYYFIRNINLVVEFVDVTAEYRNEVINGILK